MPLWLPQTTTTPGSELAVWGAVRPAAYFARVTGHRQIAEVQFARPGGRFRTLDRVVVNDPHGYFAVRVRFPASGTVRLAWDGSGPTYFSRRQAIVLH